MTIQLSYPNGRIVLTHPAPPSDDSATHRLYTHPHTLKYLPFWRGDKSLEQVTARRELRANDPEGFRDFRIHLVHPSPGSPDLIGTVGFIFTNHANDSSELGIIIAPEVHKAGYASEAIYLLLEHGFTSTEQGGVGLNRVQFTTAAMNTPMRRWLEDALGATHESTLREAWKSGDEYIDAIGYSILRREWDEGGAKARLSRRVEIAITTSASRPETLTT